MVPACFSTSFVPTVGVWFRTLLVCCCVLVLAAADDDNKCEEFNAATGACRLFVANSSSTPAMENEEPSSCTLYMAKSTIPGAGLGIFTAIERQVDDTIGEGDVMIPLSDHWYHLQALGRMSMERPDWGDVDPTTDFVWSGPGLGMQESAHGRTNGPNNEEVSIYDAVLFRICSY